MEQASGNRLLETMSSQDYYKRIQGSVTESLSNYELFFCSSKKFMYVIKQCNFFNFFFFLFIAPDPIIVVSHEYYSECPVLVIELILYLQDTFKHRALLIYFNKLSKSLQCCPQYNLKLPKVP